MERENIIAIKSFQFSLRIIELYKHLKKESEFDISRQVLRSGTSIGVNVHEASAGQSKKDFISKMAIASKEARETKYWLRLINESKMSSFDVCELIKESDDLINILTAIVKTSQKSINSN